MTALLVVAIVAAAETLSDAAERLGRHPAAMHLRILFG
jgi:hypothetical protein